MKHSHPRSDAPKLLVISNMWPPAPAAAFGGFVARHVSALRFAGAQVTVVANSDSRAGKAAVAAKYASLFARALVAAAAGRGRYDAVVAHYLYPAAAIARVAARVAGAPYALVAHGTDVLSVTRAGAIAKASRSAVAEASLVVAVSSALEARLRDDGTLPDSVPSAVVNMGFDADVFRPDPQAREKLGVAQPERIVLFAGNLLLAKGVDLLVSAFIDLLERNAADRLVLVGASPDGWMRPEVAGAIFNERGRTDFASSVTFTGAVDQATLAAWMAAADVFALPSRNEGLGLVLLEAMACGTPCVGARVGGIPEVLTTPSCGRIVAPDDAVALAAALEEVLLLGKRHFHEACVTNASAHDSRTKAKEFLGAIERMLTR